MPDIIIEKRTCSKCDADIRDDTEFCYNCGQAISSTLAEDPDIGKSSETETKTQAALDDLAKKFRVEKETEEGKLARAAEQRKKARVERKKPRGYTWKPNDEKSDRLVIVWAAVVAIVAAIVVFLVVWAR